MAAPGSGKTTYILNHPNDGWIDADEIMKYLNVHDESWHRMNHTVSEEEQHYRRCDEMLAILRERGLKVLGSLFWEFKADFIVQIDEEIHKQYVDKRCDLNWDTVKEVRNTLTALATEKNIKVVHTIHAACS